MTRKSIELRRQTTIYLTMISGAFVATCVIASCDSGDDDSDTGTETDTDTDTDTDSDTDTDTGGGFALVATTDYITGSYSTVSLDDLAVNMDIGTVHSDLVCRFDPLTMTPFIIQRFGGDAIAVLDPVDFSIVNEYSTGAGTNPHDIAVVAEDRAYISLNLSAEMLIVHPMTGDDLGTVDLSEFADADGIPEMSVLHVHNGLVYVIMALLDPYWYTTGPGMLAAIDGDTGTVDDSFELSTSNPYDMRYSAAIDRLVITLPGEFSTLDDGGIEFFNPNDNTLSGLVVHEADLGGNVTSALVATSEKGYAIIGTGGDGVTNTDIVSFDPDSGEKLETILEGDGWIYSNIALTPDGTELWIADGTTTSPGIRIIDTSDDTEITESPINVGLPPAAICFTGV